MSLNPRGGPAGPLAALVVTAAFVAGCGRAPDKQAPAGSARPLARHGQGPRRPPLRPLPPGAGARRPGEGVLALRAPLHGQLRGDEGRRVHRLPHRGLPAGAGARQGLHEALLPLRQRRVLPGLLPVPQAHPGRAGDEPGGFPEDPRVLRGERPALEGDGAAGAQGAAREDLQAGGAEARPGARRPRALHPGGPGPPAPLRGPHGHRRLGRRRRAPGGLRPVGRRGGARPGHGQAARHAAAHQRPHRHGADAHRGAPRHPRPLPPEQGRHRRDHRLGVRGRQGAGPACS